jgi:hypothetical protein
MSGRASRAAVIAQPATPDRQTLRGVSDMKRGHGVATALVLSMALSACMKDEEPEDAIPEGYKKSMEKAEQVEQKMQDAAEQRMQGLEGDG